MNKKLDFENHSSEELIMLFEKFVLEMDQAEKVNNVKGYNRIYDFYAAVRKELKRRPGDQRKLLLPFLDHPNLRVRIMAAQAVYYIDTARARTTLELIAGSNRYPHAADARFTLGAIDEGYSKLD